MTLADAETTCISRRKAKLKHLKQQHQEITIEFVCSVITTLGSFDLKNQKVQQVVQGSNQIAAQFAAEIYALL